MGQVSVPFLCCSGFILRICRLKLVLVYIHTRTTLLHLQGPTHIPRSQEPLSPDLGQESRFQSEFQLLMLPSTVQCDSGHHHMGKAATENVEKKVTESRTRTHTHTFSLSLSLSLSLSPEHRALSSQFLFPEGWGSSKSVGCLNATLQVSSWGYITQVVEERKGNKGLYSHTLFFWWPFFWSFG